MYCILKMHSTLQHVRLEACKLPALGRCIEALPVQHAAPALRAVTKAVAFLKPVVLLSRWGFLKIALYRGFEDLERRVVRKYRRFTSR